MAVNIQITVAEVVIPAVLNDGPTAALVAAALPIRAAGQRWGQEIYFAIAVEAELEADAREVLEVGELAYWPQGNAFCMFFGLTPASQADEIRAVSPVNIIGRMSGDLARLSEAAQGAEVLVERA